MAIVAALSLPATLHRLCDWLAVLRPRSTAPCERRSGRDAALPRRWAIALTTFLPGFFLAKPPTIRDILLLLAAFVAIALAATSGAIVAQGADRVSRNTGLAALAAAVLTGISLGTGFVVHLLLLSVVLLLAESTEAPRPAHLLLTATTGALATDAGSVVLNVGRGVELIALGAALALFVRLADEGPTLLLGQSRRRRTPADLGHEGVLALTMLVAVVAYVIILSSRAPTVGMLGVDGWFALLLFGSTLWLVWLRGLRAPGHLLSDLPIVLAAAATSAVTAGVTATVASFPLP